MSPKVMQSGAVLFGSAIPSVDSEQLYSHAWGGMYPGDKFIDIIYGFANNIGVKQSIDNMLENTDGYKGIPCNLVMADNSGDIGYMMLVPIPKRKDSTPYIGNRVLNGETSKYDWDGLVPTTELPRAYNPKKGFIVTANNRHMPDNANNDIGATTMSTGRSERINEIIQEWIKKGHKITVEDM